MTISCHSLPNARITAMSHAAQFSNIWVQLTRTSNLKFPSYNMNIWCSHAVFISHLMRPIWMGARRGRGFQLPLRSHLTWFIYDFFSFGKKKCINFVFKWYHHIAVLIYIPWEFFEDYLSLIIVKICYTYITYVCILNTEIQSLQSV